MEGQGNMRDLSLLLNHQENKGEDMSLKGINPTEESTHFKR